MEPFKYFVFNKRRDYESGYLEQIKITDTGIELAADKEQQKGVFISNLLDAGEEKNKWHRAVIQSENYGDDSVRFTVYCSDSRKVYIEDQVWDLSEVIKSSEISLDKKHEIMKPYLVHQILNPQDILLYHANGRFLWLEIQLFKQSDFIPGIHGMKIFAENTSFLEYLPEIYHTESQKGFLRRYLSLFEIIYQDLDFKIRNSARQLDPLSTETDFLKWIAGWAGINDIHLWNEEKLRQLLIGIVKKNLIRGTRAYMEYMIEVFTGEKPIIVEYDEIEQYRSDSEIYKVLKKNYAHGPYEINVLIREEAVPTLREHKALEKIIDDLKPAHIAAHLIILRSNIYLNQNTYLGINSMTGNYQKAYMNGMTAIPSVIALGNAGGDEEEL